MSDVEALMWNVEKDPHLSSAFANVTMLDRVPDVDRFRARMEHAVTIVPRLRQRVVAGLGRLAPPEWHDADVDFDYHVRRVGLPGKGTMRDVLDLAATFSSDPFDRTRPLWEFLVVEGVEGDRAAMLQKIHHGISDGEGAVRMSAEFIDFSRDQADPEPLPAVVPASAGAPTNIFASAVETTEHNLRRARGVSQRAIGELATLARNPQRIPAVSADIAATVQSGIRQLAVTDHAHSPLWTERSLRHRIEVLRIPLEDARLSAKALGGTVNDVFVAGAAGGAGAYHRAKGADVADLRISMPVSTRSGGSMGGNSFTPARVLISTAADPIERFAAVQERLSYVKQERGLKLVQNMAGLVNLLPTSLLVRVARQQVETIDFTTSNVRGAPFDLFIAGAKIEANYPVGPLAGTAFNITTLSASGMLDMGVNIDLAAIDDPELLRTCLEDSYAELLALGT
jgi:diacylglycerol O-acyltransferase / wax synthase